MKNATIRSANVKTARTGRRAPKLAIVQDPRPVEGFDFAGMLVWEQEIYREDPTGGNPSERF